MSDSVFGACSNVVVLRISGGGRCANMLHASIPIAHRVLHCMAQRILRGAYTLTLYIR